MTKLCPRECQVASLVAMGCANKEIAGRMGISCSTVKQYVERCFQKLGVGNRVELAVYWGAGSLSECLAVVFLSASRFGV